VVVLVHGAGESQGVAGGVEITMQVADGDDPRNCGEPERSGVRDTANAW
jgi:hypothetical protein